MTELEQRLLSAFEQLSEKYSADMRRVEAQSLRLQQHVQTLAVQVQRLSKQQMKVIDALTEELR